MPIPTFLTRFATYIALAISFSSSTLLCASEAKIPDFVGDWSGKFSNPKAGYYKKSDRLVARVVAKGDDLYEIQFLEEFDKRVRPYLVANARSKGNKLILDTDGWKASFDNGICSGTGTPEDSEVMEFALKKVQRVSPTLGLKAPAGAIVLFDGSNLGEWKRSSETDATWKIQKNGDLVCAPPSSNDRQRNNLYTKQEFEACRLHLEFKTPYEPQNRFQHRANSGVFFQNEYEVQILDSYGNSGSWDDCGALYKVAPPRVNASYPPGEWQTLDIEYYPADFDLGGKLSSPPRISVSLNGVVVQKDQPITSPTAHVWTGRQVEPANVSGSIWIQDHGHQLTFRNIWVKEM